MMSEAGVSPPEGWYPDPDDDLNQVRFWDGSEWTNMRGRTRVHPDRVRIKRVATMIGLACAVVFLLATFLSTSVQGVSCGTWLSPQTIYATTGNVFGTALANAANQECSDKLETRRLIALIALGVGLVVRFGLPRATSQQFDT